MSLHTSDASNISHSSLLPNSLQQPSYLNCQANAGKASARLFSDRLQTSCTRCAQLESKVRQLEQQIKELTAAKSAAPTTIVPTSTPGKKDLQQNTPPSKKTTPKHLHYSFETVEAALQVEEKVLQEIQLKAEKLCRKERKEREIIKQIVQSTHSESCKLIPNPTHSLSSSQISPAKPTSLKMMRIPKTNSLMVQPSPIKEQKHTGGKLAEVSSQLIIQEVPKRESPGNLYPSLSSSMGCELVEASLKEEETEEAMSLALSHSRRSMTSNRTQKETEDAYKAQMRTSKLMAKLKRKK